MGGGAGLLWNVHDHRCHSQPDGGQTPSTPRSESKYEWLDETQKKREEEAKKGDGNWGSGDHRRRHGRCCCCCCGSCTGRHTQHITPASIKTL